MQALSNSVPEKLSGVSIRNMKWGTRLKRKLDELGWSIPRLAAEMGRPEDMPLIESLGKYVLNKVDNPRGTMIADIAKAVNMSETELRSGALVTTPRVPASGDFPSNARMGGPVSGFVRVPVRGKSMGGKDGALIFNTDQDMGDVLAPPILSGVPGAYAVYVEGDSMLERFRPGEVVFVHPHLPVRKDDDCVIQVSMGENEPPQGFIKRFVSRDDKRLKLLQLNPRKFLTFPSKRVISVHRIVMAGPV